MRCPILKEYTDEELKWGLTREISEKTRKEIISELKIRNRRISK
jgi:hypothetical protein